ncbi:transposase [Actinopolyspora biskrensis]|uniref:transposase n=1 Tax=Actinopolyspora biskrensis TaxID=1470178 RepID=UPI001FE6524A|nr:transposase [Actinopolyspora biskrensis]
MRGTAAGAPRVGPPRAKKPTRTSPRGREPRARGSRPRSRPCRCNRRSGTGTPRLRTPSQGAGKILVVVDRWYPSSKTCSACGHLLSHPKLSVRAWTCPGCRARHERDVNAAKNIRAAGRAVAGQNPGEACGADVSPQGSSLRRSATKQETSDASPTGTPAPWGGEEVNWRFRRSPARRVRRG